jgi:hypothetical protein
MSRGLGWVQQTILENMRTKGKRQRTPQRDLWKAEDFAWRLRPKRTARGRADARARVKRACRRLVADRLILRVGIGWSLPPETEQEARARRQRNPKLGTPREQQQREHTVKEDAAARERHRREIVERDRQRRHIVATRAKLAKVLGMLGSAMMVRFWQRRDRSNACGQDAVGATC